MKFTNRTGESGSIKWIILLIIGIVIASYFFDFSVQDAIEAEQTQSNYQYIRTHLIEFYNAFLRTTLEFFWENIIINILWNNISEFILHD